MTKGLSVSDAAEIHEISERTIRRWISEGKLGTIRKNGVLHVHPVQVQLVAEASKRERHAARPKACFLTPCQ